MRRFSTGRSSDSASSLRSARARVSRAAATGSRSAQARGGGGPSYRAARGGRSASSSSRAVRIAATQWLAYRSAPRPRKPLSASNVARSRGSALAASTIAESGMIRPGVTSRWDAIASLVCHSSRTAARARRPRARCSRDVRRHGSCRGPEGAAATRCANSSRAQVVLPVSSSSAMSASRSSSSTSTSKAAYTNHGSGSGRVDQSTAECSLRIRRPTMVSTKVANPTRG